MGGFARARRRVAYCGPLPPIKPRYSVSATFDRPPFRRWVLPALLGLALVALSASSGQTEERSPDQSRGFLGDVGYGLKLVGQDVGAALTAPTRMDAHDWKMLGGVVAVGGLLFAFDEDIEDFVQRNENDGGFFEATRRVGEEIEIVGYMGDTWPYYAGAMGLGYFAGWDRLKRMGAEILLSQYLAGSLRNASKLVLGRRRPNEDKGAYFFELNGGTSFPSGHAASAFALAEVLAHHADRRWATVTLYSLATAQAFQRLTASAHWASDVWIGAISGVAAARFIVSRHEPSPDGGSGLSLRPQAPPFEGELGLALVRRF